MASVSRTNALQEINHLRSRHGLRTLKWSPILAKSAQAAAKEVERDPGPLKHNARWWLKIYRFGGKRVFGELGECIGEGQDTSKEIFSGWLHSPPHYDVMMDEDVTHAGIGHYKDSWALHTGEKL